MTDHFAWRWIGCAMGVLLATAGGMAAGGAAEPATSEATVLSPPKHDVGFFQVAGGPRGQAVVAWTAVDKHDTTRIWVRDRAGSGSFGPVIAVLSNPRAGIFSPALAVAPDGTELVGWVETRGSWRLNRVRVAARRPRGSFTTLERLTARGREASQLSLTAGRDGTVIATWVQDAAHYVRRVWMAVRTPAGHWGKPRVVTEAKRSADNPRVAIDGRGAITLVWDRAVPDGKVTTDRIRAARKRKSGNAEIRAAVRPPGGRFSKPEVLSNPRHQATGAFLAENAKGEAVVLWRTYRSRRFRVGYAMRSGHGRFGGPHRLGQARFEVALPRAAIDAAENVSAFWGESASGYAFRVFTARRPAGERFGLPTPISEREVYGPEIASDGAANTLVLWNPDYISQNVFDSRIEGRFVSADGSLGPPRRFTELGNVEDEAAVLRGDGSALVAWIRQGKGEEGHSRIEALETSVSP